MKKSILLSSLLLLLVGVAKAQFTYGTTGLLHMPTADMQKDKTFLFGGGYLNSHAIPERWNYNTWNYYINITFFPWMEVGYNCVIFDEWARGGKVYMKNQDRSFHVRLRLWKEGWWKDWTPQIVIGGNDVLHGSIEGGNIGTVEGSSINGNTFFQRYYIAATKHISWNGEWGIHVSYVYSKRIGHKYNGVAVGLDYRLALPESSLINKALNNLRLMAEYDSKVMNIGTSYHIWKEHVNIIGELYNCKYPSIAAYFKIYL